MVGASVKSRLEIPILRQEKVIEALKSYNLSEMKNRKRDLEITLMDLNNEAESLQSDIKCLAKTIETMEDGDTLAGLSSKKDKVIAKQDSKAEDKDVDMMKVGEDNDKVGEDSEPASEPACPNVWDLLESGSNTSSRHLLWCHIN